MECTNDFLGWPSLNHPHDLQKQNKNHGGPTVLTRDNFSPASRSAPSPQKVLHRGLGDDKAIAGRYSDKGWDENCPLPMGFASDPKVVSQRCY